MQSTLRLPQLIWHGLSNLELSMPEEWQVEVCNMAGYNRKALSPNQIREAVRKPIGIDPIRTIAKEKTQVAIIFDDMTRGTKVSQIVPFILEELAEAGVPDSNIRFIAAIGCHGVMDRFDFVKKLGEDVVRRFPVYNHNAFGNCLTVGITSFGTEIQVNTEVVRCDIKIAIGSIVPHVVAGFSGGAKIILPGICSQQTASAFHKFELEFHRNNPGKPDDRASIKDNPPRLNINEAGKLVGLDIKIDAILNSYGETVAIYAGRPDDAFTMGVKDAKSHYLTPLIPDQDIVLANTLSKVNELECGLGIAWASVKEKGGDVVLVGNAPEGHISHYLFGPWGNTPHLMQARTNIPSKVRHLYVLNEYPDLTFYGYFKDRDKVRIMSNWDEISTELKKTYKEQTRVAVYPNADIQYFNIH